MIVAAWTTSRQFVAVVLAACFSFTACTGGQSPSPVEAAPPALPSRPNIVFILTDDQRWDELQHMPNVRSLLQANGITFTNGFVSNPLCTPSRATILTGRYSGQTGVWSNQPEDEGGWETFRNSGEESHTIATVLRNAGYYTGLFGKYMNGYVRENSEWVPPGWDVWNAFTVNKYYGLTMSIQGTEVTFAANQYSTDIIGQQAVDFIRGAPADRPFFLYWAPKTPHKPYTPQESDMGSLSGSLNLTYSPSYNDADVSDKPWYVQQIEQWDLEEQEAWNQVRVDRYESLISVDRWIARIVDALAQGSRLENTLIVFTSDNGFMLGEHRLVEKAVPYEESIRVPWILRWDAARFPGRGRTDGHLMLNTDFAPTFASVAGASMGTTDGLNFARLAADPSGTWRRYFLIERGGAISDTMAGLTYCGVRSVEYSYVQYWNGFEELYELSMDPHQLTNIAFPGNELTGLELTALKDHRSIAHRLCDPVPPGFTWTN